MIVLSQPCTATSPAKTRLAKVSEYSRTNGKRTGGLQQCCDKALSGMSQHILPLSALVRDVSEYTDSFKPQIAISTAEVRKFFASPRLVAAPGIDSCSIIHVRDFCGSRLEARVSITCPHFGRSGYGTARTAESKAVRK